VIYFFTALRMQNQKLGNYSTIKRFMFVQWLSLSKILNLSSSKYLY